MALQARLGSIIDWVRADVNTPSGLPAIPAAPIPSSLYFTLGILYSNINV